MLYERIRKWLYSEDEKEFTPAVCDIRTVDSSSNDEQINQELTKFCPTLNSQPLHPEITRISCISHIQQQHNWDCGVACLLMVWSWLRNEETGKLHRERNWVVDKIGTKSIWTIDLLFLIHSIANEEYLNTFAFKSDKKTLLSDDFSYIFCSKKLEVDSGYNDYHYYQKEFRNDVDRVSRLFLRAYNDKLPLLCVPFFSVEAVVRIISQENCVAIVLLDNSVLSCTAGCHSDEGDRIACSSYNTLTYTNTDRNETDKCSSNSNVGEHGTKSQSHVDCRQRKPSEAYSGHYVVLCGVSTDEVHISHALGNENEVASYCLAIKNPACVYPMQYMKPAHFERSWRSSGTDEDIIFIMR